MKLATCLAVVPSFAWLTNSVARAQVTCIAEDSYGDQYP
jgi:hypothetical protein